jgi:hypothetical protein
MASAIGSCHTGAVKYEGDSCLVKSYIHQDLVESATHKSRIHGNNWMQSTKGHTGR